MKDLAELGYYFDDEGVLRTQGDDEPFKFTTQEAYEELGEAIDEEVYKLLEKNCKLKREPLKPPGKNVPEEDLSFIFVSKNCKKAKNLLVLIHGSGVVRAGQWARRLIINDNLNYGTQIPYIKRAMALGWGIVVMNTNLNASQDEDFKYSRTPVEHAETVWKSWIEPSEAEQIYVVAHSRGGYDTASVLKKYGVDERIPMPGEEQKIKKKNVGKITKFLNLVVSMKNKLTKTTRKTKKQCGSTKDSSYPLETVRMMNDDDDNFAHSPSNSPEPMFDDGLLMQEDEVVPNAVVVENPEEIPVFDNVEEQVPIWIEILQRQDLLQRQQIEIIQLLELIRRQFPALNEQ